MQGQTYATSQGYQNSVDKAIGSTLTTLGDIDRIVDASIHISNWAAYELEQIDDRPSSPLDPIKNFLGRIGLITPTTEEEVRQVFVGMTDAVENRMNRVLTGMRIPDETLLQLRDVLENIAIFAVGDKAKLQREKLNQHSYWKFIFRSYRNKLSDFDTRMEICASFLDHVEKTYTVVSNTKFKMQQLRAEMIQFQDGIRGAPLALQGGSKNSLQPYINMLKSGVKSLEDGKYWAESLKEKKVEEMQQKLQKSFE